MNSFLKSPRPSLPLKRAPPLSPSPFPLRGQGMCQPPYSVLKPLRYKVGGPSEVFASSRAAFCGMRPHGHESLRGCLVLARSLLEVCLVLAQSFFRNPTSPPLPLREGPPLISVFSPQGRRGNRPTRCSNRFAIWLADHQWSSPAADLHFAVCDRMDANRLRAAWCLLKVCSKLAWCLLEVFRKSTWISLVLMTEVSPHTS